MRRLSIERREVVRTLAQALVLWITSSLPWLVPFGSVPMSWVERGRLVLGVGLGPLAAFAGGPGWIGNPESDAAAGIALAAGLAVALAGGIVLPWLRPKPVWIWVGTLALVGWFLSGLGYTLGGT